jgi:uncharacterized glyoxalase superfamily protein PhnB
MKICPREPVIFAINFKTLINWYVDVLAFRLINIVEDHYHYCYLENSHGIAIGIADSKEMGVFPTERKNNTVVLQFEVTDVSLFFEYLKEKGGTITFGPSYDKKDEFWYGGFNDLEGNPFWVVDDKCP